MGDKIGRINLNALQKTDPYAKYIIDKSSHVAFYTFDSEDDEWSKTDVEGAFFIYARNAEPNYSIFINNRLNTDSLIEPITGLIELQRQPPFLLYRNERSRIRGFWFHNNNECERIADLFGKLIKECEQKQTMEKQSNQLQQQQISANNNNNNVDIFSMLSKAQEDFNNSMGPSNSNSNSNNTNSVATTKTSSSDTTTKLSNNHQPDVTSSVMNFFAAAKPTPTEVPMFQRMLSNPVHVELLEKQQRVTTPHENKSTSPQQTQQSQNITAAAAPQNVTTIPVQQQQQQIQQHHHVAQPVELGTSPLATFLNTTNLQAVRSGITNNPPLNATDVSDLESRQKPLNQLLRKTDPNNLIITPSKPALLLPNMFVSPSTGKNLPFEQLRNDNVSLSSSVIQRKLQQSQQQQQQNLTTNPEPLTQSQLQQAMNYLIKNDPEFIKKLHEAYLKSFTEMVSL